MRKSIVAILLASVALPGCSKDRVDPAPVGSACTSNGDCANGLVCLDSRCASISFTLCPPARTRCNGSDLEVCAADGSGFDYLRSCASGCSKGACVAAPDAGSSSIVCVHGTIRCNGAEVEECNPAGTGYDYLQSCLTTCQSGQCAGLACAPFTLSVTAATLADGGVGLPADNSSTMLVRSGVIADINAAVVPDGTLFTVSASNSLGGVLSFDVDPVTAGIQVASVNGRIDYAVRTGPGANDGQTATVDATTLLASKCKGSATVQLTTSGANAFVAEDFTRATYKDTANTTAVWQTGLGQAVVPLSAGLGSGEDGDLYVQSGVFNVNAQSNPANLGRTFPDAVNFRVTGFTMPDSVTLAVFPAGLVPGDEVLLLNLRGNNANYGNVGNYELFTVKAVDFATNKVTFASPILKIYGATADNATLTGQSITLQRVPRYGNVTIGPGATLTANGWSVTTGLGGVLFFKASGIVVVSGSVTMSAQGYPAGPACKAAGTGPGGVGGFGAGQGGSGNCGCNALVTGGSGGYAADGGIGATVSCRGGGTAGGAAYGDALLTKWYLGASGGQDSCNCDAAPGGGIVVIWASIIGVSGGVSAVGGGGAQYAGASAGGSIYLRAVQVNIGSNLVTATGGSAQGGASIGGNGRIRIDAQEITTGNTTNPAYAAGASGGAVVRTLALDNVATTITQARISSALQGTQGGTITYELSSNGGTNWIPVVPGDPLTTFPVASSDLRLRITLTSNAGNQPLGVQGVAIEYLAP